ncbi:sensor histidine kinase [Actinomycetospora sp. C-140]
MTTSERAPERTPDRASVRYHEEPSVRPAGDDGGDWTERLALRNWSLPVKLAAVLLVPTLFVLTLGVLRIVEQTEEAASYDGVQQAVSLEDRTARLMGDLAAERSAGAVFVAANRAGGSAPVDQRVEATNRAVTELREADGGADSLDGQTRLSFDQANAELTQLDRIRDDVLNARVDAAGAIGRYTESIDALEVFDRSLSREAADPSVAGLSSGLYSLAVVREEDAYVQAVVAAGIAAGRIDAPSIDQARNATLRRSIAVDDFRSAVGTDNAELADAVVGPDVDNRDLLAQVVLGRGAAGLPLQVSGPDWERASAAVEDRDATTAQQLRTELQDQAGALQASARSGAGVASVILLLALMAGAAVVFFVTRSLLRPLRLLRRTALDVAERRLPQAVRSLREGEAPDTTIVPTPISTREEIGQVARAFDQVHEQAVRLAAEQAGLRSAFNSIFVNLSRRSQALVERQLRLIEQLENSEEDPEALSNLFQLDHLATRMRRNSENLLVLSGTDLSRRGSRPVPLVDVLRAAASEVEQYQRIDLAPPPQAQLLGRTASDVVHLVAELLENATTFSAPDTRVQIRATQNGDGSVLVEILDSGVGMSEEDLHEANVRLDSPPTVDVSASRRMGLFVVGRLATRHHIAVELRNRDEGGVVATAVIPATAVLASAGGGAAPAAAVAAGPPQDTEARNGATGVVPQQSRNGGAALPQRGRRPVGAPGAFFSPGVDPAEQGGGDAAAAPARSDAPAERRPVLPQRGPSNGAPGTNGHGGHGDAGGPAGPGGAPGSRGPGGPLGPGGRGMRRPERAPVEETPVGAEPESAEPVEQGPGEQAPTALHRPEGSGADAPQAPETDGEQDQGQGRHGLIGGGVAAGAAALIGAAAARRRGRRPDEDGGDGEVGGDPEAREEESPGDAAEPAGAPSEAPAEHDAPEMPAAAGPDGAEPEGSAPEEGPEGLAGRPPGRPAGPPQGPLPGRPGQPGGYGGPGAPGGPFGPGGPGGPGGPAGPGVPQGPVWGPPDGRRGGPPPGWRGPGAPPGQGPGGPGGPYGPPPQGPPQGPPPGRPQGPPADQPQGRPQQPAAGPPMWNGAPVVPPPGPSDAEEAGEVSEGAEGVEGAEERVDEPVGDQVAPPPEAAAASVDSADGAAPSTTTDAEPSDEDAAPARRGTLPLRPRVLRPQPRTAPAGAEGDTPAETGGAAPGVPDAAGEEPAVPGAEAPATDAPADETPAPVAEETPEVPEALDAPEAPGEGRGLRPTGRRLSPGGPALSPGMAPRLRPRRSAGSAEEPGEPGVAGDAGATETAGPGAPGAPAAWSAPMRPEAPATPEAPGSPEAPAATAEPTDPSAPSAPGEPAPQGFRPPPGSPLPRRSAEPTPPPAAGDAPAPEAPQGPEGLQPPAGLPRRSGQRSAPPAAFGTETGDGGRLFDAPPAIPDNGNGHARNGGAANGANGANGAAAPGRAVPERLPGRAGTPRRERTPIYDEVASAWFREAPPSAGPDDAEWASTSGDEGWRAAAATADALDAGTSAGGTTESGLPRRRPRAQLVPGAARTAAAGPGEGAAGPRRSAEAIRGRLASYQQGVADGRTTRRGRPADTADEPAHGDRLGDEEEQ